MVAFIVTILLTAFAALPHAQIVAQTNSSAISGVTAGLDRQITIDFTNTPLREAVREISQQAGLQLYYRDDVLPVTKRVTLRGKMPARNALRSALHGTGVSLLVSSNGEVALARDARAFKKVQGVITGKVTDAKSGRGISGANISMGIAGHSARTGEDGAYRLANVPAGTHTVQVRLVGYARQSKPVTVGENATVTADFALEPSASVLDQVVVTGTVVATERKALPTPITVVTAEDITRKGITRLDQLFHGEVPGMWAKPPQAGDKVNSDGLFVRGSASVNSTLPRGNPIKTYIDGVEVYDHGRVNLLDPSSIERIEIVRGPQASTIYGVDALYGVMQIFTKKGQAGQRPKLEASLSAGTMEGDFANLYSDPSSPKGTVPQLENTLSLSGATASTSYRVGGRYHYEGPWQQPGSSERSWDGSGGFRLNQGRATVDASAQVGKTILQRANTGPGWMPQRILTGEYAYAGTFYLSQLIFPTKLLLQTLGGTLAYQATDDWQHTLTVGQNRFDNIGLPTPYASTGEVSDSLYRVNTTKQVRTSIAYNTTIKRNLGDRVSVSTTIGADHWDASNEFIFGTSPTGAGSISALILQRNIDHNTGYFTQFQMGLADALFLTAGMRAEANPNFGEEHKIDYAPRGGISYVTDIANLSFKARASYGRAITPPAIGQKVEAISTTVHTFANPGLLPAVQLGGDIGVEIYYSSRASLQATYYNQTTRDIIALVGLTPVPPFTSVNQYQNVGRVHNTGWELEGHVSLPVSLGLRGTYTVMNSKLVTLGPNYTPSAGQWPYRPTDQLRGVPHTSGAATLAYTRLGMNAEVTAEYTGRAIQGDEKPDYDGRFLRLDRPIRNTTALTVLPAYTQVHVRFSRAILPRVAFFAQVNNVTRQYTPAYRIVSSTVGRTSLVGIRIQ